LYWPVAAGGDETLGSAIATIDRPYYTARA
jgi:hypothetical protein